MKKPKKLPPAKPEDVRKLIAMLTYIVRPAYDPKGKPKPFVWSAPGLEVLQGVPQFSAMPTGELVRFVKWLNRVIAWQRKSKTKRKKVAAWTVRQKLPKFRKKK